MPTTTPSFGWPVPVSSDLVKDGATAIESLGDAIDASLVDLKGGTTNQVLAKNSNTDMDFKWVADASGIPATIIDAKGDLIAGTAADTVNRLAVGANGETLVADSSASVGLSYQANFAAGKNKIINGDFRINQRNFTSNTASGSFNFDRWFQDNDGGTVTCTPQTFTPGAAPVAGYEGTTFLRQVVASQTTSSQYAQIRQKIESVRTFAGQTITLSFWAKAASGTPKIAPMFQQDFGGGSANVNTVGSSVTLSTSWARYSVTVSIPSLSGKTIGTSNADFLSITLWTSAGSTYNSLTNSLGLQNNTFDIWGIQVEAGSVATAFQTATGTIQGELAACMRYYERILPRGGGAINYSGIGHYYTSTNCYTVQNYATKRTTTPTVTFSGNADFTANSAGSNRTSTAVLIDIAAANAADYYITTAAATAGNSAVMGISSGGGWIAIESEL